MKDRKKPVAIEDFGGHVSRMHADRDKWFEMEYNVSAIPSVTTCMYGTYWKKNCRKYFSAFLALLAYVVALYIFRTGH